MLRYVIKTGSANFNALQSPGRRARIQSNSGQSIFLRVPLKGGEGGVFPPKIRSEPKSNEEKRHGRRNRRFLKERFLNDETVKNYIILSRLERRGVGIVPIVKGQQKWRVFRGTGRSGGVGGKLRRDEYAEEKRLRGLLGSVRKCSTLYISCAGIGKSYKVNGAVGVEGWWWRGETMKNYPIVVKLNSTSVLLINSPSRSPWVLPFR